MSSAQKLKSLRNAMKTRGIDIYIVPSEDQHSSEYIAPCHARRSFISGFTGSAGCAVISMDKAVLATDGRYFNQASHQLSSEWTLLRQGIPNVPTWQQWCADQASDAPKVVGIDPTLITADDAQKLDDKLKETNSSNKLEAVSDNLIDEIWGKERPDAPNEPIVVQPTEFTGMSSDDKITLLRNSLKESNAFGTVISMLDEVAWLLNLRGGDIPFSPVFFSYVIVTESQVLLYVDQSKASALTNIKSITVRSYDNIMKDLKALGKEASDAGKKVLLTSRGSWAVKLAVGFENAAESKSFILMAKANKNDTELQGMRDCHIQDGAALVEYFSWLEHELKEGKSLDEVDGADKLEGFRRSKKFNKGLSFPTINSTGANAAVIHYQPEKGSCKIIDPENIYLCDSGGQYSNGTTDVTRTFHFRNPSVEEKLAFANVLKGHIALSKAVFPAGTTGFMLDVLARQHLWASGQDYRHGTGHGVGSYLLVHEGPIGIGPRIVFNNTALSEGMILSNEPGFYKDGSFGIRIENLVAVTTIHDKGFGDIPYFGFENLTMCPMGKGLLDESLLTKEEKIWLNDYHKEVKAKLSPLLAGNDLALKWLEKETSPI